MSVVTWSNRGRADEVTLAVGVRGDAAAVDHQGRAFGLTGVDVSGDSVPGRGRHQWAHVAAAPPVAGAQVHRPLGDVVDQVVGDLAHGYHGGDRHAALPGGPVPGV